MSIFDKFTKTAANKNESGSSPSELSMMTHEATQMHSADVANNMDDDLPSVNRKNSSSKLINMIGSIALAGAGAVMLYYINTDTQPEPEPPKPQKLANNLPPLEIPALPVPERPPELEIKSSETSSQQPIAVKSSQSNNNQPPQPTWLDRRMGGNLVIGGGNDSNATNVSPVEIKQSTSQQVDAATPLALKLKATISPGVSASMLPNRDFIIAKGASLDCALETAIDSSVPGITTCRLTRDIYSDNGHVVLLDRGSQLVGEYQGGLAQGQARIFVLWTRVKTPNGVVVNLDSPGADTLGRAGHSGWVDTHFAQRFGAAILLSLVKDTMAIIRQNNNNSQLQISGNGANTDQLATEILKNTANIPPTLIINQGDHIQIMVTRDLDFSTVYGLKLKEDS